MSGVKSSEITHDNILKSALVVFSEKGYFDATIKDIATKAGCNTVTVFRHFDSKEALFRCVVETFNEFEFDPDELDSKLSYMNLYGDFRIMADHFFVCIYDNIHKLRIFINEANNFEFIKKYLWFIPDALKTFVSDYIISMYPEQIPAADVAMIAEMFVCYILRTCLRLNVHQGIEEGSKQLMRDARPVMEISVEMIVDTILMIVEKNKKQSL